MKRLDCKYLLVITLLVVFSLSAMSDGSKKNFDKLKNLDLFNVVYKELDQNYVDTIDPNKAVTTAINSMTESLDPYTNYFTEDETNNFKSEIKGNYGGIGAAITSYKGQVAIDEPYEDMPAAKAGVKAGDIMLEIDGKSLKGLDYISVSECLRGVAGSSFLLKVERPGTVKPIIFKIIRANIQVPAVPYYDVVNDSVGYIMLSSFTGKPSKEFKEAFLNLTKRNIKSLIIDLRDNGGGLLDEAVIIANYFLPKGKEVVSTRGRISSAKREYKTTSNPLNTEIPIAILVNSNSASASEVFTGAMQDYDRAVVIGGRTFGKGLVQTTHSLPYGAAIKITTAKYYTPSGRCVQAIDYKHRNADGSVGRIPDSLTNIFHTADGRIVRDGGGITPDFEVKTKKMPNLEAYLTDAMDDKRNIFDFATLYCLKHHTVAPAKDFELSDADYDEFKAQLKKNNFTYDRESTKLLKELRDMAYFEGYQDTKPELDQLEKKLSPNLYQDLDYFKKDIKKMIATEILSRYQYQKGAIIEELKCDDDLQEAFGVLRNKDLYHKTLSVPVINK
jgi:carboxyl-terminal processing protease